MAGSEWVPIHIQCIGCVKYKNMYSVICQKHGKAIMRLPNPKYKTLISKANNFLRLSLAVADVLVIQFRWLAGDGNPLPQSAFERISAADD